METEHTLRIGKGPQYFVAEVQPPFEETDVLNNCEDCVRKVVATACIDNSRSFGSHAYLFKREDFGKTEFAQDLDFLEYIRERVQYMGNVTLEDSLHRIEAKQKSLFEANVSMA